MNTATNDQAFWRREAVLSGLAFLVLAGVTLLLFLPALSSGFINYDDPEYVTENQHLRDGISLNSTLWAFSASHSANWHPLTWLSHGLDVSFFGLNPAGHHLVSILLHIGSAWVLFVWLRKLTHSTAAAIWIAALFAWHPTRVESVVWIAERKDVLSTFFGFLALLAYHPWATGHRRAGYALALLCGALALLAKPMWVTLPALLLLLDLYPYRRISLGDPWSAWRGCLAEKLPFIVLASTVAALTVAAQRGGGAVVALDELSLADRLINVAASYGLYLGKLLWPWPLYLPYGPPAAPAVWAAAGAVALGGATVVLWRLRRTAPFAAIGGCWFLGTLIPVIGIVKAGEQFIADRYTYVPYVGLALMLASLAAAAVKRWPRLRTAVLFLGVVSLVALAPLTRVQAGYWKDSETLFRHTLAHDAGNATAHNNLGTALMARGRGPEALYHFQEATRIAPGNLQAQNNLGVALLAVGQAAVAARQFEALLKLTPDDPEAWVNYGAARLANGDSGAAAHAANRALELRPADEKALRLRAQSAEALRASGTR